MGKEKCSDDSKKCFYKADLVVKRIKADEYFHRGGSNNNPHHEDDDGGGHQEELVILGGDAVERYFTGPSQIAQGSGGLDERNGFTFITINIIIVFNLVIVRSNLLKHRVKQHRTFPSFTACFWWLKFRQRFRNCSAWD